ncbi:hypothetical protein HBA55_29715 [Pseudomaricurvus alkylphenolicus]|uniref:hypothetical protein n=1 Tax=Pseudomaricurvus alkylphenolicus TaxID=1306991 RepID=UPI001423EA75|nr:hypothetical protein [Pseudomaricurvus alkylphenolicus]NIB43817.1 hypothetical protein [Pseudomaricurvus alkylphenolicus]
MAGYQNSKVNELDVIAAEDLEAVEAGDAELDAAKINNVSSPTVGNLPVLTAGGGLTDSGQALPGGSLVGTTGAQKLEDKELKGASLSDLSEDHKYNFVTSELTADRNVTLPVLAANDTFVFLGIANAFTGNNTHGGTETFNKKVTLNEAVAEKVHAITGTNPDLDPANGLIQTWALTANQSPVDAIEDGEHITLMIDDGSAYEVTWPTITWIGGAAPDLATTGYTVVELWKVGSTLYGVHVGNA